MKHRLPAVTASRAGMAALIVAVGVLAVRVAALESAQVRAPGTTAFTFQGRVTTEGVPFEGTCDGRFRLHDALSGGAPIGAAVDVPAMAVANGLFAASLDFGAQAFASGERRFIAVELRCPAGGGSFVLLEPRQELTATPYALFAFEAGHTVMADFATDAEHADSADQVPFSGITGIPPGFGEVAWENVVIVARSGGDFTSIQAAIDSISNESASNPYVVWIAPGTYSERVIVPPFVSLVGAGQELVTIESPGAATLVESATVTLEGDTVLAGVSVLNTGGDVFATGIRAVGDSADPFTLIDMSVRDVRVRCTALTGCTGILASGSSIGLTEVEVRIAPPSSTSSTATGILITGIGAAGHFRDVEVRVTTSAGSGTIYGVRVDAQAQLRFEGGLVQASSGSSGTAIGIDFAGFPVGSVPVIEDLTVSASVPLPGASAVGLLLRAPSAIVTETTVSAAGSPMAIGVSVASGTNELAGVRISVGNSPNATGIEYRGSVALLVTGSQIGTFINTADRGVAASPGQPSSFISINNTLINASATGVVANPGDSIQIASSLVPSRGANGAFTCVGSFEENYQPISPTCQ